MKVFALVVAFSLASACAQTAAPVRQPVTSTQQPTATAANAKLMGSGMSDFRFVDDDELRPLDIEHRCEEMYDDGGALHQKYNYIVYHFSSPSGFFYARAYLHEIGTVSVYGPFDGRNYSALGGRLDGSLDDAMLAYLKRRFAHIQRLGGEGYVTVWQKPAR